MELTRFERLLLANQYLILSRLTDDPHDARDYDRIREALEYGYPTEYEQAFANIADDALSERECRFVLDVLDMYGALQDSYSALKDEDKVGIEERYLVFPGFDGNHETKYMSYARFLVYRQQRFTYVSAANSDFNSHTPVSDRYRRMLAVWEDTGRRHDLERQEVLSILRAFS